MSLCWWHPYICDRPQSGLCSQKAAQRFQCYWEVVWTLEHKNQWRYGSGNLLIKTQAPWCSLTLNARNIPFVNHVEYLGVIFDKRITWRLHIEMTEDKAFRTFIRIYSLFEIEILSAKIKVTFHKALIISVMRISSRHLPLKIAVPVKQGSPHHWKFPKVHIGRRFAHGFQPSICIWL
jgi:hypothetical protein